MGDMGVIEDQGQTQGSIRDKHKDHRGGGDRGAGTNTGITGILVGILG